jgi:hypothetical protein
LSWVIDHVEDTLLGTNELEQAVQYAVADLRERTAALQQLAVSTVPSRAG